MVTGDLCCVASHTDNDTALITARHVQWIASRAQIGLLNAWTSDHVTGVTFLTEKSLQVG